MRFALVVAVAVALPTVVFANRVRRPTTEVYLMLADHVDALTAERPDSMLLLAKDATVILPLPSATHPDYAGATLGYKYHLGTKAKRTAALGDGDTVMDKAATLAYFQRNIDTTARYDRQPKKVIKRVERIGGIARHVRGGRWEIVAVMYTPSTLTDEALIRHATANVKLPEGEPSITGDATIAASVRDWFKAGIAPHAAERNTLIASGTAPKEYARGADAKKLVQVWDTLGIVPSSIDVTNVDGKLAFVRVDAVWPKVKKQPKKGTDLVPLTLGIVLAPEADGWRWVSMQYSPG